jgi:hypothetical protein
MSVSSGFVISELLITYGIRYFEKTPPKPFSCGYCLSFWTGCVIALYFQINLLEVILYGFSSAYLYYYLNRP